MATIDELKWSFLTPLVNEMKSPNQFLKRLLFGNTRTLPTETIEISVLNKARETAPFVRKNGEAVLVPGYTSVNQQVEAPNIRIKMPFTPSELLFNRRPGTVIFSPGADAQVTALQQHIARDMQVMADLITNSEELLCSMALQGVISYQSAPNEAFQVTYPRPAGNNVTLTTFWDDANPELPEVEEDFTLAKRIVNDEVGLNVRHAIMGLEAAEQFRKLMRVVTTRNDKRRLNDGNITFAEQFSEDGVIYMGRFCGVDCWEYGRTVSVDGVDTSLIRSKYVEFVTDSPAAEHVMYYGAIPDFRALDGRLFQGERFSKSWDMEDPSQRYALVHSRPLPVTRRPGSIVSMKVVSG